MRQESTIRTAERQDLRRSLLASELNTGFALAVLDGIEGELRVSHTVGSGAAYVRHGYGMSLIWGDCLDEAFDEIVRFLSDRAVAPGHEWLQIDPRWAALPWATTLASTAPHVGQDTRVNFSFDPARFAEARESIRVPDGWVVAAADASDFEFVGSVVPAAFWRDSSEFLGHGGGWRAQRDGAVGALAFSSFPIYSGVEIGIETLAWARGQGLAAAVSAAMIDGILSCGVQPIWACRQGNTASYRLAVRLGFTPSALAPNIRL